MLILESGHTCPHTNCPYDEPAGSCNGTKTGRAVAFTCKFATETQILDNGKIRNPLDQTGNMKVIME
jgi:hypothetical protein